MLEVHETTGIEAALWFYPGASRKGAVNVGSALLLRIAPANVEPWTGVFAAGSEVGETRLLTCPDPHWLCVISRGAGYFVDSGNPQAWHEAKILPIQHALAAPEAGLLLLASDTTVEAWNSKGLQWRSGHIAWDGLRQLRVEGMQMRGEGWHPDCWEEFTLDLRTGKLEGGPDLGGHVSLGSIWSEQRWNWSQMWIVKSIRRLAEQIGIRHGRR